MTAEPADPPPPVAPPPEEEPPIALPRRRWRVLALVALTVLVLVLVRALPSGRDTTPPPQTALGLVPADALVVVHASTDRRRDPVAALARTVGRFGSWPALRDRLLDGLTPEGCPPLRAVGREAVLALVPTGRGRAGSLILVDAPIDGHGHGRAAEAEARRCGRHEVRRLGRFLAIGTPTAVAAAVALHERRPGERSFVRRRTFAALSDGLPADRVVDAWFTTAGLRRVVAPQGGLLGAMATLLDRPDLEGVVLALTPDRDGARIVVRSRGARPGRAPASPTAPAAPAGALGDLVTPDPVGAVQRLLAITGDREAATLVRRLTTYVTARTTGADGSSRLRRDVLDALRGPSELVLTAGGRRTAAAMAVVVPVTDGARAGRALRALHAHVAGLAGSPVRARRVAGRPSWSVRLGPDRWLGYLVDGNRVIAWSRPSAARAVLRQGRRLGDVEAYRRTTGADEKSVMSVGFLDFRQLLRAAERSGLAARPEYVAVRGDLARVRAVGMVSRASGGDTTASIDLWIP